MSRRWWFRLTVWALAAVALAAGFRWAGYDVDPLVLGLVSGVGAASVWLLVDTATDLAADWSRGTATGGWQPAGDRALASYARILEDHRAAKDPGPVLRDRLAVLARRRLAVRGLALEEPAARELLGEAVWGALTGPPRRLGLAELETIMDGVEEL